MIDLKQTQKESRMPKEPKFQIKTYINGEKFISHEMTEAEMLKYKRINEKNNVVADYLRVIGNEVETY
tara:strand:+ start:109 stop:312 length:204 start_codon:yes stop_codon:yes gene_type:complete